MVSKEQKVWGRNTLPPRLQPGGGGRFRVGPLSLFYATPYKREFLSALFSAIWKNTPLASQFHFFQYFSVCSQRPRSSKCSCCIKLCCESGRFWTGPRRLQEWSVHQSITGELSLHLYHRDLSQFSSSRCPTIQEKGSIPRWLNSPSSTVNKSLLFQETVVLRRKFGIKH